MLKGSFTFCQLKREHVSTHSIINFSYNIVRGVSRAKQTLPNTWIDAREQSVLIKQSTIAY